MTPPPGAQHKAPLSDSVRRLIAQSMDIVHGRFELFKLEVGEERDRLGQLLVRGLFAAFFILLSVQLVTMLIVALVWDTPYRVPVVVGLATTALFAAVIVVRAYKAISNSTLFANSVDALAKDVRAVEGLPR